MSTAHADPALAALRDETAALAVAYPGTELVPAALASGRRIVRLPEVPVDGPGWAPGHVPALLVCDGWPQSRPQLLVHASLTRDGAPPPAFAAQYLEGDSWYAYSFSAPYTPARPALVPVVRAWLQRFDGRPP